MIESLNCITVLHVSAVVYAKYLHIVLRLKRRGKKVGHPTINNSPINFIDIPIRFYPRMMREGKFSH